MLCRVGYNAIFRHYVALFGILPITIRIDLLSSTAQASRPFSSTLSAGWRTEVGVMPQAIARIGKTIAAREPPEHRVERPFASRLSLCRRRGRAGSIFLVSATEKAAAGAWPRCRRRSDRSGLAVRRENRRNHLRIPHDRRVHGRDFDVRRALIGKL